MFRSLRIAILLAVLLIVGGSAWLTKLRTTSWQRPLRVAVFPIDADDSQATQRYTRALTADTFQPIADFMNEEAGRYRLPLATPIEMYLAPGLTRVPPPPPLGGSAPQVMLWSLQMRYWAWVNAEFGGPKPHVRMFVLYHDPKRVSRLSHSLGLQKGLIGVVNAFASEEQTPENNVVIAHELLLEFGCRRRVWPGSMRRGGPRFFG